MENKAENGQMFLFCIIPTAYLQNGSFGHEIGQPLMGVLSSDTPPDISALTGREYKQIMIRQVIPEKNSFIVIMV